MGALNALLLRLSECYTLHHDELQILNDFLEEKDVTEELFTDWLKAKAVTDEVQILNDFLEEKGFTKEFTDRLQVKAVKDRLLGTPRVRVPHWPPG
jgi:hypothetical protein